VVGRVADRTTTAPVQSEVAVVSDRVSQSGKDANADWVVQVPPLFQAIPAAQTRLTMDLLVGVGLVVLALSTAWNRPLIAHSRRHALKNELQATLKTIGLTVPFDLRELIRPTFWQIVGPALDGGFYGPILRCAQEYAHAIAAITADSSVEPVGDARLSEGGGLLQNSPSPGEFAGSASAYAAYTYKSR
jgi:hypothetical protein